MHQSENMRILVGFLRSKTVHGDFDRLCCSFCQLLTANAYPRLPLGTISGIGAVFLAPDLAPMAGRRVD
jgi:hypothetical protein